MISRSLRQFSTKTSSLKTAVVLSGWGVFDGAEITESIAIIVALSRENCTIEWYAPDMDQMHVLDHTKGEELDQTRNVMVESARIARGNVKPLSDLNATEYDAIFFPGGFGAAKNLSDFGVKGADMSVIPEVEKVLMEAKGNNVNIGMCCIAPVIAARVFGTKFGGSGCKMTLGKVGPDFPYSDSIGVASSFGNDLESNDVDEYTVDKLEGDSMVRYFQIKQL